MAEHGCQAAQADMPRKTATFGKGLLAHLSLVMLTACQAASSRAPLSISARTLAEEYEQSPAAVRSRYDGKVVVVTGYAANAARMPGSVEEQGSVSVEEKDEEIAHRVVCWFSKDQTEPFSKIKRGQYVTVQGVFNGEASADLKFCKLVKVE